MRRPTLVLALSAALIACGGDDALSTSEYRAEAKAICEEATRSTRSVAQPPARPTNEALASYFERLITITRRSTDRLGELEPPEDLARQHEAAVKANEAGVKEVERLIAELERGGDATALLQNTQTRLTDLSRRSDEAARALGVPQCARQE